MNEAIIDELLSRSVREILPSKEALKARLMSGDKLRIYIGTDATGTSLHLGHSTNYLILEKFRQLGHEVIFLIGDFTSRIGDPTDKSAARTQLTREEVVANVETWLDQVRPIINLDDPINPVQIKYNHDWLSILTFEDIIHLASHFTVQHMLERDMFEKRLNENKPIFLHEFFYPLMQGYDSVAMDVDIEMCGSDQTFNALAGRTLQRKYNNKEKFVFVTTLLENPITGQKMMSKSQGTGVFLDATPNDLYGGIMAQADENIRQLFIDTTTLPITDIEVILNESSPMDAKKQLAFEITKMYRGEGAAVAAAADFVSRIQNKEVPTDIPVFTTIATTSLSITDALVFTELTPSKSEARRKIIEGAIYYNGERVTSADFEIPLTTNPDDTIIKFGRRYAKIKITSV
jgi:tyrosyl-tRNA synthetase